MTDETYDIERGTFAPNDIEPFWFIMSRPDGSDRDYFIRCTCSVSVPIQGSAEVFFEHLTDIHEYKQTFRLKGWADQWGKKKK